MVKNRVKKFNWKKFKEYVDTYDPSKHAMNEPEIIFKDMLYGIGIAIDKKKYGWANGFTDFKKYLSKNK